MIIVTSPAHPNEEHDGFVSSPNELEGVNDCSLECTQTESICPISTHICVYKNTCVQCSACIYHSLLLFGMTECKQIAVNLPPRNAETDR